MAVGDRPAHSRPTVCGTQLSHQTAAENHAHKEPYQKLGPPPASLQVTRTVARVSDKAQGSSGARGLGIGHQPLAAVEVAAFERDVLAEYPACPVLDEHVGLTRIRE